MFTKTKVRGKDAHPFFKLLTKETNSSPKWNFHKYLISPDGSFNRAFTSLTKPMSGKLTKAIEKILPNK